MKAIQSNPRLGVPFLFCTLIAVSVLALSAINLHPVASAARPSSRLADERAFPATSSAAPNQKNLLAAYGSLPIAFEANQGQTDPRVKYVARGRGYTLFLTSGSAVLSLRAQAHSSGGVKRAMVHRMSGLAKARMKNMQRSRVPQTKVAVLRMQMLGAKPDAAVVASDRLPGKSNYFLGRDPRNWHTNVSQYGRVEYKDVYPGVNVAFHGERHQLEFDYVLAPGADASAIALRFLGAKKLNTDSSGDLILATEAGDLRLQRPVAYQEANGQRRLVDARFQVNAERVGFTLGTYDRSRELVIDPTLSYSTYLGGNGEDEGFGITVDATGNAYIVGDTDSSNFPGASGATNGGGFDAFVTKLNAGGGSIGYTALIGGSGAETADAIAVDSLGNAYVGGITESSDFYTTPGAPQTTFGGGTCNGNPCNDGFIVKLDPTGTIVYSTYLGSSNNDNLYGIAIDGSGNAFVAGETFSSTFPLVNPLQTVFNQGSGSGDDDGFVTEINASGTAFLYSTYLGGSAGDLVNGIALDGSDNIYVAGDTVSGDFPITAGAFQTQCKSDGQCGGNSLDETFVTKINAGGASLGYSTYLGGSTDDVGLALALDSSHNAYVTGYTNSTDFPVDGPFQAELLNTNGSAFVTKLNPTGSALVYSSFLGGSTFDAAVSIAVDQRGNAYVTGTTLSVDFPTADAFQPALDGNSDAFIAEVNATGQTKVYSTFYGGDDDENFDSTTSSPFGGSIATVHASGAVYVTGATASSSGFPLTSALQNVFGGAPFDAFAAAVSAPTTNADFSVGLDPPTVGTTSGQSTGAITVAITPLNGSFSNAVSLTCSNLPAEAACNFGATSVTPGGSQATTTLTISTNGATGNGMLTPPSLRHSVIFYAMLLPIAGVALIGAGAGSRKKKLFSWMLICLILAGLLFLAACGGGSSSGGGGNGSSTPSGAYQFTVTGTSGSTSHTAIVTLVVQ